MSHDLKGAHIIVTGCAGFIGMHVAERLLAQGAAVTGIDAVTPYYDTRLKEARLERLSSYEHFRCIRADLTDTQAFPACLDGETPDYIVHLAAQPGVRHSLKAPLDYIRDNVEAHTAVIEYARNTPSVRHVVYASSSSVYGANEKQPFSESDRVTRPNSLYAATKGACELVSRSYASLYGLPQTGLRFFTVYGPWGRPDMAPFLFLSAILEGKPITVFNHGNMKRDFTYIDDIAAGTVAAIPLPPLAGEEADPVPHRVVNLGNNTPVELAEFIRLLENAAGRKAEKIMAEMQQGDVYETYADISTAQRLYGFAPETGLAEGLAKFADWYKGFYHSGRQSGAA